MRHGALYLIIRDVHFLNHRGVNDWKSLIKGSFRCFAYVYARLQLPGGFFQLPKVAPYDMRALCKECGLLPAALSCPWIRPSNMICMYDVVATVPHVPVTYINPCLLPVHYILHLQYQAELHSRPQHEY